MTSTEFVNHASYIIEFNGKKIITDPWLEYRVFNEGWQLLSDSKCTYEKFKDIDYIWFSHEHPDHFMPRVIKKIPKSYKSNITVLYQKTIDKKVKNFCERDDFKEIIELSPNKWISLDEKTKIMCTPFGKGDSWLAFNDGEKTILNLNDCPINTKNQCQQIKSKVGKVSVLFSQFSYANWVGNKHDSKLPIKHAKAILDRLELQCKIFSPEFIVPFASFVVFCRSENSYFNNYANKIGDVYDFLNSKTNSKPIILYPGDVWDLESDLISAVAIEKYDKDLKSYNKSSEAVILESVTKKDIKKSYEKFMKRVKEKNSFLIKLIPDTYAYIEDLSLTCRLSYRRGIKFFEGKKNTIDIITKSNDLSYCLDFDWGADTLSVNGCFQVSSYNLYRRFRIFFLVPTFNNHGLGILDLIKIIFKRHRPFDGA